MDHDRPLSVVPYIGELVDEGIPVLVYNGDRDMTTNMVGTELALNAMEWSGQDDWLDAKRGLWMADDYQAGWAKELNNLTFVVVYNSGHMVPYNRPVPAFDMLTRLLTQKSFIDEEMPLVRVGKEHVANKYKKGHHTPHIVHTSTTMEEAAMVSVGSSSTPMFQNLNGTQHVRWEAAVGMAIVSMVIGALLAMVVGRSFRSTRNRRSYEPIRDSEF